MALSEFSTPDILSPLITDWNAEDIHSRDGNLILTQLIPMKVGFEETVYTSNANEYEDISEDESTDTRYVNQYEDISEDESTDSSTYSSLPQSIADWKFVHILKWLLDLYDSENYRYEDLNLEKFKKRDGTYLMNLTETEWEEIDKKRSKWLYENVQRLIKISNTNCRSITTSPTESLSFDELHNLSQDNEVPDSAREYPSAVEEIEQNPPRRKRGRPRSLTAKRRPEQKIGRVWEFLRNLLMDPQYCPSLIYWEDYETKKFRLVDGTRVAKLWGQRKNNPTMTYEKFSRTIRHYYKDKVILSVPKEKLVYRFGVNAKGVETDQPNFGYAVNLR